MDLKDAVAIVTGGARGIGRGIAYELAKEGARIVIADVPETNVDRHETIDEIAKLGSEGMAIDVDVRDPSQTQAMVAETVAKWGQVDVLVNNAGVIKIGPVAAFSEDDWDLVIDVNMKGTFLCSKAVAPQMMKQQRGRIINLSSIAGKHGRPGVSAYSASKWGVIGFTQALAYEMAGFGVTVNAICPGEVKTFMWDKVLSPAIAAGTGAPSVDDAFEGWIKQQVPLGRAQTAADMGQAAVFLCRSDAITGVTINVSGGTEMG